MAKKLSKPSKTKSKKKKKEKKPLVFDLSDGVTYHDFLGIFVAIFRFIWRLAKIIFAPVFWIYGENVRMYRFVRASSKEEPMDDMQREFFETIPVVYSLTGLVGGILVGSFAVFSFQDAIQKFLDSLSLDFLGAVGDAISWFFVGIWDILVWIVTGIANGVTEIYNWLQVAFGWDPFLAFMLLVAVGIVVAVVWIILSEKGVFAKITNFIGKIVSYVFEYPDDIRSRIGMFYRKMNHKVASFFIGEERIATRTQVYFRKSVFYTALLSIWSFGSGIYVGLNAKFNTTFQPWTRVIFTATVLLVAGIISGLVFLTVVARLLDWLNRKTYIAPEFIVDDNVNEEALKERTKELHDAKPWLKPAVEMAKGEE